MILLCVHALWEVAVAGVDLAAVDQVGDGAAGGQQLGDQPRLDPELM